MKHWNRLLALVLALLLCLPAALAEAVPVDADAAVDPVLFTFDGEEVRQSRVDEVLYNMLRNGYVEDESDYDAAIQALVQDKVLQAKIAELGFDQFTEEEEAALLADAQHEWEEALDYYVNYFLTEDTEEARAQTRAQAETYYIMNGYDLDALYEDAKRSASYDKLQSYVLESANVTVSEDEIASVFQQYAEGDRDSYEGNIQMYEMYTMYYGYDSWYIPEGYRGITHILLNVDEELLSAYQDAQAAYEEAEGAEVLDVAALDKAQKALDEAKAAVLASEQDVIDDVYARLEKGEAFAALVDEYGEDPGMKDEENRTNGYSVHAESMLYDPAFVQGAFSEKMQKPGDVSDPVIGSYGIHILYYLRDVPAGIVELSDAIREEITHYLTNFKSNQALSAMVAEWTAAHEIVYNDEAIAAAKAQGQAE